MLTDKHIKGAIRKGGTGFLSESLGRGHGSLLLRYRNGVATWWYQYTINGAAKRVRLSAGPYGEADGTLEIARAAAQSLATERRKIPDGDLLAERERAREAEQAKRERQDKEAQARQLRTVARLMAYYVEDLEHRGRTSARAVRREFDNLLRDFPHLGARDASTVTTAEWASVLRRYYREEGKVRKGQKIRVYLGAAYRHAIAAANNPLAAAGGWFGIDTNPLRDIPPGPAAVRKAALTEAQLREFLARIRALDNPVARAIEMGILLGGQRPTQLLRARVSDYADGVLRLSDPKGRRAEAREHVLPTRGLAAARLDRLRDDAVMIGSTWLFTRTGRAAISVTDLDHAAKRVFRAMGADNLRLGDLRETLETVMATIGIPAEIREQIQSHGLGTVVHRHYQHGDFLPQKAAALARLEDWLEQRTATVVPLRGAL